MAVRVEHSDAPRFSPGLTFLDGEGAEVTLDDDASRTLLSMTGQLEAATVSACPGCRSRVLAAVALVDLLGNSPPHPRSEELIDLADDAPTLHVYVVDGSSTCRHTAWLDPGSAEWADAISDS